MPLMGMEDGQIQPPTYVDQSTQTDDVYWPQVAEERRVNLNRPVAAICNQNQQPVLANNTVFLEVSEHSVNNRPRENTALIINLPNTPSPQNCIGNCLHGIDNCCNGSLHDCATYSCGFCEKSCEYFYACAKLLCFTICAVTVDTICLPTACLTRPFRNKNEYRNDAFCYCTRLHCVNHRSEIPIPIPQTCGEVDIAVAENEMLGGFCNAYTCLCCSKRKHTDPEPNHDRRSPYLNWGGGDGSGD